MNWKDEIDRNHKGQTGFFKEIENEQTNNKMALKVTSFEVSGLEQNEYEFEVIFNKRFTFYLTVWILDQNQEKPEIEIRSALGVNGDFTMQDKHEKIVLPYIEKYAKENTHEWRIHEIY